jgi:ABC-type uncharacterized transport system fused permease/ATPase subunit
VGALDWCKMCSASSASKSKRKSDKAAEKAQNAKYFNALLRSLYRIGGTKLVLIAVLTLVRTALLNYQGRLQGFLFKAAFLRQVSPFMRLLLENVVLSWASSSVESTSKHVLELMSIKWQEWLTKRMHSQYFANMVRQSICCDPLRCTRPHAAYHIAVAKRAVSMNAWSVDTCRTFGSHTHIASACTIFCALQAYYQMSYVDRRITDPEQLICEDAGRFGHELAQTTGSIASAIVDGAFYCVRMYQYSGTHAYTAALAAYVVAAGGLTTIFQPNFGGLVRKTQALEGDYRGAHEKLRGASEAVALLGGIEREAEGVRYRFGKLVKHTKTVLRASFYSGIATDFLLKYLGATAAVVLIIGPFFQGRLKPEQTLKGRAQLLSDMRYHTRCAPTPAAPLPPVHFLAMPALCHAPAVLAQPPYTVQRGARNVSREIK